ncbi:Na+/H+ antiporter NhaC family protein [Sporosarcina ureilytica]|uniref:Sodium:proton antiporter n=1 Tax=Sporosarcina ureilytica TaxID=298596 RepID=A0A1D8JJ67_9BACL|nr:Na+/H+ antiporter NhaC family protein [Sporosarcina ureilytica]AOV08747.1 sodium:proton antiporter [Sporosarcina ureilytica]
MAKAKEYSLDFKVSKSLAFLPLIIFMISCILFFVVFRVYEMEALAMGGFIALIIGSLFAKSNSKYWDAVIKGMSSKIANTLILILFIVSFFGKLMAEAGAAEGFVWIGMQFHLTGAVFTLFTFLVAGIIATATGTSIGTLFAAFPLLYPAGILLGSDPIILAGAILSGAIMGDSFGPISDVTITSSITQKYTKKEGHADIMGMVKSRLRYVIPAAILASILFLIFGGTGEKINAGGYELIEQYSNPHGLIMIIPIIVLLVVAVKSQNIFLASSVGTIIGIIVAVLFGAIDISNIFMIQEGALSGFLIDSVKGVIGTIAFVIPLFGIIGVLEESGSMNRLVNLLMNSKLAATERGAELTIAIGATISGISLGGANGPACLMFGPLTDEIGKEKQLHPYRTGNLLSGFACSLPIIIPFTSSFIIITYANISVLVENFPFIQPINPLLISIGTFFPAMFFIVFLFAVLTGWGRRFEGKNGKPIKHRESIEKSEEGYVN